MGVVNVTPDSFSDGGVNLWPDAASTTALGMLDEGAAIIDVGGESTRPGSEGVPVEEELRRVVPVLEALAGAPVSIDTAKAEVARRALELGAELVNDVTAFRGDPELAGVVAEAGAYCCLMHMKGEPRTMQADPRYDDVVSEVKAFLEERLAFAVAEGIPEELVCLDPGIGFGKTVEHNFELARRLPRARCDRAAARRRVLAEEHDCAAVRRPFGHGRDDRGLGRRGGRRLRARRPDPPGPRRAGARRGATRRRGGLRGAVKVELRGLELFGHHGVHEHERENGQLFLYDVELEVGERGSDDRIENAVDYSKVAAAVREVAGGQFRLLEALATAIADLLAERFEPEWVKVRVRKPEVRPAGIDLEFAAVTVERRR